jgi:hypothetical protein
VEVVLSVNVVNVKSLEAIFAESTDKIARINSADRSVTKVKTSHESGAVESVYVSYEFFRAGAGGVVDYSVRLLPHVLNAYSNAVFLGVGLESVIELHIPLEKLLGNTGLAIWKMLNGVNNYYADAQIGCVSDSAPDIVESLNGSVHILKGRTFGSVSLIENKTS